MRAVVVAPVNEPAAGYVVYEHTRRAAAGRRLDRTLAALREAGIPAHGGVFDGGPLTAVKDVLAQEPIDELIVSTHPEAKSGWLRRDLIDEIRKAAGSRPVEHVVADVGAATGCEQRPRRRQRDGALGESLLDTIRQRAAQGPASFLIICSAERSGRRRAPAPRGGATPARRAVRAALRGHRRARADRAPRSLHRDDGDDPRRARRRGDRLDLPGRALGMAAARSRRAAPGRCGRTGRSTSWPTCLRLTG